MWFHRSLVRIDALYELSWDEELVLRALNVRAELWVTPASLLVREVCQAAQQYRGRTFASVSRRLLCDIELPEIFDLAVWSQLEDNRLAVLDYYKKWLKAEFTLRSTASWRRAIADAPGARLYLKAA